LVLAPFVSVEVAGAVFLVAQGLAALTLLVHGVNVALAPLDG
jgi:hypothetical protein